MIKVKSGSVVKVMYLLAAVVGSLSSLACAAASLLAYLGEGRLCQTGIERASWKSSECHIL